MSKVRARAIPIFIVFLFLLMSIQIPSSDGVMTGPVVTVTISDDMIEIGDTTTVTVKVEDVDGESSTPMDLVEVRLSVTMGTFEPETAITDVDGECTFTYHAPDEVDGPTDVTITAFAEQGVLDPSGNDEVQVTYRLMGQIIGPSQVLAGSGTVQYIIKVTANDQPVAGVYAIPTVFGAGTKSLYTAQTNATGETILTIHPASDPGQLSIIVQLRRDDYLATSASKGVNVVDELAPLRLEVTTHQWALSNWGARRFVVRAIRGGDPVGGIPISFTSDLGYFIDNEIITDIGGNVTGVFIASHDEEDWSEYNVSINISSYDGVEVASYEQTLVVSKNPVELDLYLGPIYGKGGYQGLLFPGEQFLNSPRVTESSGYHRLIADMSLEFRLIDQDNEVVYRKVLASGLSTFDLIDGSKKSVIYDEGEISLYTVPDDPIEGNFTFRYCMTDRTGDHVYKEERVLRYGEDGYYDLPISIHKEGKDDWTFIYYLAGDNDLSPYMDHELERLENEAPDGEFKVYVMFDRTDVYDHVKYYNGERWKGAKWFDLEEGRENGLGPDRASSSDYWYLHKFMLWVSQCSPTGNYCLVLSDHGKGYRGMCWDQFTNPFEGSGGPYEPTPNHMSIGAIKTGLRDFSIDRRPVSVLTLAACGMSGIEIAARLHGYVDYIVASQLPTYSEHGLTTEKVLQHLKGYDWENYSPTPFQVSVDFINGFVEESGGNQYDSSICVMDTSPVQELADDFNSSMRLIYNNWILLGESFSTAYEQTTRIPGPELGEYDNGDLKEFIVNLREEMSNLILDPSARAVFNRLGNCIEHINDIVAYSHLIQGLNGINIFMPTEPVSTNLGIFGWDYLGALPFAPNFYVSCLVLHSGGEYYPQDGDDDDEFTPLDPVQGHVIDEDDDGLGNIVVINISQNDDEEVIPFRVVIDCLQFSGKGGGYVSDMLKKRVVLDQEDLDEMTQLEIGVPDPGWYDIVVRVLDENNNIVQKFLVGNYTMEETEPEGAPPSLNITASEMTLTVGDELDLTSSISDPDGDDIDLIWDFDHRDGIFLDSDEEDPSTRYLKPGNVTVTCIVTDGEYTVVKSIDLVIEAAVGNNAPTSGMTSKVYEWGEVTLDALDLSSDPDDDELYYKFNFGDGNWSEWIGDSSASHHYSETGVYNCSVRVMDIRGSVSERSFLLVTIENVSNKTGEKGEDEDPEPAGILAIIGLLLLLVVIAILPLAILALILVLRRKKDTKEEEEDEEEETW